MFLLCFYFKLKPPLQSLLKSLLHSYELPNYMLFNKFSVTRYVLSNTDIINHNMLNVNNMSSQILP